MKFMKYYKPPTPLNKTTYTINQKFGVCKVLFIYLFGNKVIFLIIDKKCNVTKDSITVSISNKYFSFELFID